MRGWAYSNDQTAIFYGFNGKPSHVATIATNLDRAIDDAQDHVGAPFASTGQWGDADTYCDTQYMPPWPNAKVCKVGG